MIKVSLVQENSREERGLNFAPQQVNPGYAFALFTLKPNRSIKEDVTTNHNNSTSKARCS
jgi:hypothetical protein